MTLFEGPYKANEREAQIQELWSREKTYSFVPSAKQILSIDTPPPTVSGNLHIGHVYSYTHTDILARYKRQAGFAVYYPMGFDDNGLPTERYVEKQHKIGSHTLPRHEFRTLCQTEVAHAHAAFAALWKQLGLSVDWDFAYSTISPRVQRLSQQAFIRLYAQKRVARTAQASLFCAICRTAVAQAELESLEKKTEFYTIPFTATDGQIYRIATTRPEMLPACVAVFYNPNDERFTHLAGARLTTPFFNTSVPCYADEKVEPTKGTGLVMCCTFGDQTDIYWQQTHQLPTISLFENNGTFNKNAGFLAGLKTADARAALVARLREDNLILAEETIIHATQIHERCKHPIEYTVLPQWSVAIKDSSALFLAAANEIEWVPAYMKARYDDWVSNLKWDWCISRQRSYGIPLPVWHCTLCETHILANEADLPVDPTIHKAPTPCPTCGSTEVRPDTDVLDTWFTSSLSPYINQLSEHANPLDIAPENLTLPFSLRPQAHDIIRTWAFYTIVQAQYQSNSIPWKTITISGHVTAGNGKISKSQGGAKTTPHDLLTAHSADAIRYWSAQGMLGVDTALSEEQMRIGSRLVTKLWNAFKFIAGHISTRPAKPVVYTGINKWLWSEYTSMFKRYTEAFERYDYSQALAEIDGFFWKDFCDTYLELSKDQLFNKELYPEFVYNETRSTLFEIGIRILQCYSPIVPHICETLYQELYRSSFEGNSIEGRSITTLTFLKDATITLGDREVTTFKNLLGIIENVRKQKSLAHCSLKTPVTQLTLTAHEEDPLRDIALYEQMLKGITTAQAIVYKQSEHPFTHATKNEADEAVTLTMEVALDVSTEE